MAKELRVYAHGGAISSYALTDECTFKAWMAAAPRSRATEKDIFEFMANDALNVKGSEVREVVLTNAVKEAKKFFDAKLGPALDATEQAHTFATILEARKNELKEHGQMQKLATKTVAHVGKLVLKDKSSYGQTIVTWVGLAVADFVKRWFEGKFATLEAPASVTTDATVRDARGIGCNVYTVAGTTATKVGTYQLAAAGSSKPNHAERKWIETDGDAAALRDAARIDFHITAAPCGEQCAQLLMNWVETKDYGEKEIFVWTYKDYDSKKYVYKLTAASMLKMAGW